MADRQSDDPEGPVSRGASRASGRGEDTSSWYRLAGIGFEFIAVVGLLGGIGWWLDGRFNTAPWLMIAGFGVGFATGLFLMVRAANRMFRD
jgi:F0F1-type ATP synthase assembly protein I